MHRLPHRIATVMLGTIGVFMVTLVASLFWLGHALDEQAREHALAQIRNARSNLLAQVRLIALDYSKWEAALTRVEAGDLAWIYDNIGFSASTGQAFQLVVLWGGPFGEGLGWTDDGRPEPRHFLLDAGILGRVEVELASIPHRSYGGTEFFAWHAGSLYILCASRFEPLSEGAVMAADDLRVPRLVMGRRVTDDVVRKVGQDYLLTGVNIVREEPATRSWLPLPGIDGEPAAYLAWDNPRPGTALLWSMLPLILAAWLLISGLAALAMALVRRNAQELVRSESKALAASRTDAMTGLPNRLAFQELLATPAPSSQRAVLFLDVNGFKRINDSIGHEAGDRVLRGVSDRLSALAGPGCILARISGDEFVFVLAGPRAESRVRLLIERIEQAMAESFRVLGHQLRIRLAMGYSVQDADDVSGETLVRQADLAMYEAKRHRVAGAVAYSAVIEAASKDAALIEKGLRRALDERSELSLVYQPIATPEGHLAHAEVLARWTSPELGIVAPDRFIAVAEQAGLIVPLGYRLFEIICGDLSAHPDLRVSINISPLQLLSPDFVPSVLQTLAGHGIDPGRIEMELTEAVLVDDSRTAAEQLEALVVAGFSTALDDFGKGYSSVGYLEEFHFSTLKVDRSFVARMRGPTDGAAVLAGMITMAHGLGLRVVVEGVETAQEFEALRELGCDLVQGYHVGRPVPLPVLRAQWLCDRGDHTAVA